MSTTRLTFLYPHLFRSIRVSEVASHSLQSKRATLPPTCRKARCFATTRKREQRFVQRHGKAVEPFLQEGETVDNTKVFTPSEKGKQGSKDTKLGSDGTSKKGESQNKPTASPKEPSASEPLSEETLAAERLPGDDGKYVEDMEAKQMEEKAAAGVNGEVPASEKKSPTETILEMPPPPTAEEENASKPPHLQTPPYVHHFDTYSLVQQVEQGGFTNEQSITAMKAVRGLLALNLDVAKAGLVSKSDVENESYLFRAACSELKTEVENSRKKSEEAMRRERTLLQHEVDILNQKLTQEVLTLKDELKGMFDDRKMTVRQEQRAMESAIQELNYKITVSLNSDSKSEVEGLRWVLTRRSVMGILFMAFMVLTSLRYASYKSHEEEELRKKAARSKKEEPLPHFEDLPAHRVAEILTAS